MQVFNYLRFRRDSFVRRVTNLFGGPKYDGRYLRTIINSILGNLTMKQTLTNTVIPTFDIKRLQPIIFSTADVNFYPNNIL